MKTEISFLKPLESAVALCDSFPSIVIRSKQDYDEAEAKRKTAREYKEALLEAYNNHPTVIEAKEIQAQKIALEKRLDAFNKDVKSGPMRKYDDEQEAIRLAEEARRTEILRKEAVAEIARLVAEQKKAFDLAEKERKAALKKGDEEAATRAAVAAERARQEAAAIKSDAASAPAPTVVLEATHEGVSRRKVFKWRLSAKDGRKFLKGEITPALRLKIADLGPLPAHLFVLSPVLLNEFVDSLGDMAGVPGVLEIAFDMV